MRSVGQALSVVPAMGWIRKLGLPADPEPSTRPPNAPLEHPGDGGDPKISVAVPVHGFSGLYSVATPYSRARVAWLREQQREHQERQRMLAEDMLASDREFQQNPKRRRIYSTC